MPQANRGAECLTEVLVEGIEEDVLHREWVTGVSIQLSPPLGLSNLDPVTSAVAGTVEPPLFDKGFQQDRLVAIAGLPVLWQAPGDAGQNSGGQVLGTDPGKDKEAGVVYDQMKVVHPLLSGPADEPVAGGEGPGRSSKAQRCQKMGAAKDQVPNLRAW
nr:hypothetical protein [Candidatus Hakubella thermalkaliphila]